MPTRVEAAQEGPDEDMTEALAASSERNVRPRTAQTSSRMGDFHGRESEDQKRWVFRMSQGSRQRTSRRWVAAGCGTGEFQSDRIVLLKQIW